MTNLTADVFGINTQVSSLQWLMNRKHGLLDRIDRAILAGHFIESESQEAIDLVNAARELRELADKILARRNHLLGNRPVDVRLQAAE